MSKRKKKDELKLSCESLDGWRISVDCFLAKQYETFCRQYDVAKRMTHIDSMKTHADQMLYSAHALKAINFMRAQVWQTLPENLPLPENFSGDIKANASGRVKCIGGKADSVESKQ